jgi:type I restriction enzyme M protein
MISGIFIPILRRLATQTLLDIFDIKESYKLPDKIMEALMSDRAEMIVREIKENTNCDIRDLFQEEQGDRKKLKQDFTPDCIATLVADLMKNGDALDMCSGVGTLTKAAVKAHGFCICEQEFSERTIPFALLEACMEGMEGDISRADCLRENVVETFKLQRIGDISIPKEIPPKKAGRYDNVIMNPPYSMKFQDAEQYPMKGFVIPKNKADYGFLLRGLEHLKDGGRLIAILPHGVLFRGNREGEIREQLTKQHLINAVIGLPDKLFLNTSIPVCLLILEQDSPNVLFVDASKDFEKGTAQNDMNADQIHRIVDAFEKRRDIENYAHIAAYEEIAGNDYNLSIPRYVDTFKAEPLPDIENILRELKAINEEVEKVGASLYRMLGELVGSIEDEKQIKKHRELLERKCNMVFTKEGKAYPRQLELRDLYEFEM